MGFWPHGPLCLVTAAPPGQRGEGRWPGRKSTSYKLSHWQERAGKGWRDSYSFSYRRGVGGVAFPTSCGFNRPDALRSSPLSGLQVPTAPAAHRTPPLPRLNPPLGKMGSMQGNAVPGTHTALRAGALCPGNIPKIAPGPSPALKIRLRGEGCSRAHLTRDAAGGAGQLPGGTGYQTGRAGKRVCKEKLVLNARVGPDGHTPECAQAQDAASPLSIAIPSHAGECPCTGHSDPARVTLPETPRKSPRGRRCPPRCGLRANLKHPQWKKKHGVAQV